LLRNHPPVTSEQRESINEATDAVVHACKAFEIYAYQPRKATDPLAHPDVPPERVYAMDRTRVITADVFLAVLDRPSYGVGQELEIAASFGVPTILLRREGAEVSRMVLGSFLNRLDEIVYDDAEDLKTKLTVSLERHASALRRPRGRRKSNLPDDLEMRLMRARECAGLSVEEAAAAAGISIRHLHAIEEGETWFHNVGIHVLGRLMTAYGIAPTDLFAGVQRSSVVSKEDPSIRELEKAAQTLNWSAADFLQLRDDYRQEVAASGRQLRRSRNDWQKDHSAMEERRLREPQAAAARPSSESREVQRNLFRGDK
jgi:transcriptional regulator with XRE-family HTH domain